MKVECTLLKMPLGMRYIITPHFNVGLERHLPNPNAVGMVQCNQGQSRSPGIGLLYLASKGIIKNDTLQVALAEFEKINPGIKMAGGKRGFLEGSWGMYIEGK